MAKREQRRQEKRQEVTQLLSQASQNGNLGRREFEGIIKAGGNADRVLQRAVANRGLTINSGVVNQYNKGKYNPRDFAMRNMSDKVFGAGFGVNPIIQQIRTAGKLDPKSTLFIGSKGSTATVLPRGYGGPTAKPAVQSPLDTGVDTTDTGAGDYGGDFGGDYGGDYGGDMGGDMGSASDVTTQGDGGLPGGGAGIDSAAGLKSKKSSRRQLGLSTKGTKQLNRSMMISNLNFA